MSKTQSKKSRFSGDDWAMLVLLGIVIASCSSVVGVVISDSVRLEHDKKINNPDLTDARNKRVRREISILEYNRIRKEILKNTKQNTK